MEPSQDKGALTISALLDIAEVIRKDRPIRLREAIEDALAEAGRKVALYRKPAQISLSVTLAPDDAGRVMVAAVLTERHPNPSPRSMIAYLDRAGRLFEEDPSQATLPLAPVEDIGSKKGA